MGTFELLRYPAVSHLLPSESKHQDSMTQHAVAQVQAQKNITEQESLGLVQSLLRVSIYHMTQLRGLFPDSYYEDVTMKKLDGMKIKVLKPRDEESKRLVDWIDAGAYDAIQKGYLKTMFFSISKDIDGKDLLEEYLYNFSYGPDGVVSMDCEKKRPSGPSDNLLNIQGPQQGSVSSVRYQVIRLMRMLVQLCRTLDEVPTERYLFCRFAYYGETPEEYEPPFFKASTDETLGRFSRRPFAMRVGGTTTPHHQVSLTLKSLLCQDDDDEYNEDQDEVSHGSKEEPEPAAPLASSMAMLEVKAKAPQPQPQTQPQPSVLSNINGVAGGGGSMETGGGEVGGGQGLYEASLQFALRQKQVDVEDLLANFVEIRDASHALSFLERMHGAGLIHPHSTSLIAKVGGTKGPSSLPARPGVYTVVQRKAVAAVVVAVAPADKKHDEGLDKNLDIPESALDAPSYPPLKTSARGKDKGKAGPALNLDLNPRGAPNKSEAELELELIEMEGGSKGRPAPGHGAMGGNVNEGPEASDVTMAPSDQGEGEVKGPGGGVVVEDAVMGEGGGGAWIEGSQQSGAQVNSLRKRKVSVVSDPIRQSPGKSRRLQRSTAESQSQEPPLEGTQVLGGGGGLGGVMAGRAGLPPKGRQNHPPILLSKPFPSLSAASGGGGGGARAVQGKRR